MTRGFFFGAILGMSAFDANACSCRGQQGIPEAFATADAVFSGEVIEETSVLVSTTVGGSKQEIPVKKFAVRVERWFKGGSGPDTLFIHTGMNGAACGVRFGVGRHYIIYGQELSYFMLGILNDFPRGEDVFWTNQCTRTRAFDEYEVMELEALK